MVPRLSLVPGLVLFIIFCNAKTVAQNNAISWWAFDAGFGIPNSSTAQVKSALGQSFVGLARQSTNQIESGFLVDTLLRGTIVSVAEEEPSLPDVYSLSQNYPNPFNPVTRIQFSLPAESHVRLIVYNILGQEIASLINAPRQAGNYLIEWDAAHVGSGVYFYRIEARPVAGTSPFTTLRKMMLLR